MTVGEGSQKITRKKKKLRKNTVDPGKGGKGGVAGDSARKKMRQTQGDGSWHEMRGDLPPSGTLAQEKNQHRFASAERGRGPGN